MTPLELADVSRDLSLGAQSGDLQDWGIEQSDPARVDEFMAYFAERKSELSSWAAAELTDLILQSAEEGMESRTPFDLEGLRQFVMTADAARLQHWLDLQPTAGDPWLVPVQLRRWAEADEL